MKFTATAGATVKLTASAEIFSTGKEFTLTATGKEQYVAINPTKENETTNFSYSINDVKCKEKTQVTFKPKAIYAIEFEVPVAKVGEQGYFDINDAIAAANGATVTLLADATVSKACQINKNGHTLTVNGNFVALKNYKNANGYYDVVAATKHAEFKLRGDFNYWGWDGAKDLYIITGTNLWVAPEVELTANETFKFANESWGNAWGAENDNANPANMWFSAGQNNLKVKTAGTYNVYYDFKVGVYRLDLMGAQFVAAEKVTYYLRANGSTNWDQGGAWFVAHFWNDANETYDVKLTAVPGKTGYYSTTTVFKGNYTKVIFIRMSKGATNMNNMWTKVDGEKDGYWNKTGNVTLPTDTRNLFTPSGWDNATTTWGTYQ